MKQKTYLSDALSIADTKAKYDAEVKKILSAKIILAWIMKFSMEEFKDYPIEEIMTSIEGEPEIATIPVYPGKVRPEAITGLQKEFKPGYSLVTRGVFYCARMLSSHWALSLQQITMMISRKCIPYGFAWTHPCMPRILLRNTP